MLIDIFMKTFLTLFVLFFSSSVFAEFPSSLFGITLNEPMKNYIKENEEKYVDTDYPELFSSYGIDQIKNLIKNSRFDDYTINENKMGLVDSIMGSKFHDIYEQDQCIEKINELTKTLSAYYLHDIKLFKPTYYKYFWKSDNTKEVVYGFEKKLISKMHNNEFDHLIIFCEYFGGDGISISDMFGLILQTRKKTQQFNKILEVQYINNEEFLDGLMLLEKDLSGL